MGVGESGFVGNRYCLWTGRRDGWGLGETPAEANGPLGVDTQECGFLSGKAFYTSSVSDSPASH